MALTMSSRSTGSRQISLAASCRTLNENRRANVREFVEITRRGDQPLCRAKPLQDRQRPDRDQADDRFVRPRNDDVLAGLGTGHQGGQYGHGLVKVDGCGRRKNQPSWPGSWPKSSARAGTRQCRLVNKPTGAHTGSGVCVQAGEPLSSTPASPDRQSFGAARMVMCRLADPPLSARHPARAFRLATPSDTFSLFLWF
jgi:hypothetical protein